MPLGENVLDISLGNKSSELQGHLINPLYFSFQEKAMTNHSWTVIFV